MKKEYRVAKYFDDHFELYVTDILTKEEAEKERNLKQDNYSALVSYEVRKV